MEEGDWCAYFGISSTSKMYDTSKTPLPSGRKPDIVHVLPGHYPSEVSIVAVGDLKRLKTKRKGTKKEMTPVESIGQRNSDEVPARKPRKKNLKFFKILIFHQILKAAHWTLRVSFTKHSRSEEVMVLFRILRTEIQSCFSSIPLPAFCKVYLCL